MIEYDDIPFKNDRTRLFLYEHLEGCRPREYYRLIKVYSDNQKYESPIIDELYSSQYIRIEGGDRYSGEEGVIYTTEAGIKALSSGRYPSELRAEKKNRYIKLATLFFSGIASVSGFKYLVELISSLIK